MKNKHVITFKNTILPALGMTPSEYVEHALIGIKSRKADESTPIKEAALNMMLSMGRTSQESFEESFDVGCAKIGSRHKIDNFIVYEVFNIFVLQDKRTGKVGIVDPFNLAPLTTIPPFGVATSEIMLVLAKFIEKELDRLT